MADVLHTRHMETDKLHYSTSPDQHALVETESSRHQLEYVGIFWHGVSIHSVECTAHRLRLNPEECLVHVECMSREGCMVYEPCMEYTAAEYLPAAANDPGGELLMSNIELMRLSHCKDNWIDDNHL